MATRGFWIKVQGRDIHVLGDKEMSDDDLDMLEKLIKAAMELNTSQTSADFPKDLAFECEMCGKPMEYRFCGMCTHCEMVWNS